MLYRTLFVIAGLATWVAAAPTPHVVERTGLFGSPKNAACDPTADDCSVLDVVPDLERRQCGRIFGRPNDSPDCDLPVIDPGAVVTVPK